MTLIVLSFAYFVETVLLAHLSRANMPDNKDKFQNMLDLLGPSYARNTQFWKALTVSSGLQGLFLPFVVLAFFNFYTALSQATWLQGDYQQALKEGELLDPLQLGNGEWWYIGLLTGAGLAVGLLKVVWSAIFPNHVFAHRIPSLTEDLASLKAHDCFVPIAYLAASALSIGLGATCGPEAALGATGTAVGTLVAKWLGCNSSIFQHDEAATENTASVVLQVEQEKEESIEDQADETDRAGDESHPIGSSNNNNKHSVEERQQPQANEEHRTRATSTLLSRVLPDFSLEKERKLCVLDGIAAGFGAIFPSQLLSPLLIYELGGHFGPGSTFPITETLARAGVAATLSYGIFVTFEDRTLLEQMTLPVSGYDVLKTVTLKDLGIGALLGIICGIIGYIGFLSLAILGMVGMKCCETLDALGEEKFGAKITLGKLLTPAIGGCLLGLIYVAAPACLGDGSDQMGTMMSQREQLGKTNLFITGLLKLVAVGVSLGFGFIGGPVFPFLFAGTSIGSGISLLFPDTSPLVIIPCCIAAIPTAFVPAVFMFTILTSMMFALGGAATSPIFIASVTSYTTVAGMGLVQSLILKAESKEKVAEYGVAEEGHNSNDMLLPEQGAQDVDETLDPGYAQ